MGDREKGHNPMIDELKSLNEIISSLLKDKSRRVQESKIVKSHRSFIDVVLDAAGALVVVYDRAGRIVCFNRACEEATGYTFNEVSGKFVWEVLLPDREAGNFRAELDRIEPDQPFIKNETSWLTKEGEIRSIIWENTALSEDGGAEGYVIGIGMDITELRQMGKTLRESEEKYRKLVESANDAIFIADAETGKIIDANRKAGEILNLSRDEIVGMHQTQLHPKEESLRYRAIFERAVREGRGIEMDLHVVRRDGSKVPVDISASVIEIGGKKIIQGIFRDITERVEADKALRESEQRYRTLAESAQDHIFIIDMNMEVRYVNTYAAGFTGQGKEEIVGTHLGEIFPPDVANTMIEGLRKVFESGEPQSFFDSFTLPGKNWALDTRLIPLPGNDGEIVEVMGISREVRDPKASRDT